MKTPSGSCKILILYIRYKTYTKTFFNSFLYSEGFCPVNALNDLLKWEKLLKPHSKQTSVMLNGFSAKSLEACTKRYSFTNCTKVLLVIFLKYLQKEGMVILTIDEICSKVISSLKLFLTKLKITLSQNRWKINK